MKSLYFVNYGIYEAANRRGKPICLSDCEIAEIVRPLTKDIRKTIKDDKISIISSNGKKSKQAAIIVGKGLGIRPIFRNELNKPYEGDIDSIIKIIPRYRNQIVLLGVNQIETVIDSFMDEYHKNLISGLENITSDRQFCPYEVWRLDITNKNLHQAKPSIIH